MFLSVSLDVQRTVEVRKERKYSRTALGVMSAELLSFVMTAMRNCSTIQCSYLKTSNDSRTSFGAKNFLKMTKTESREKIAGRIKLFHEVIRRGLEEID